MKYLLVGRDTGRFFGSLAMDKRDSGFPVAAELLTMANDAQQAQVHLANMPSEEDLKTDMVRTIIGDREIPTKLQFALSQRLYYEELLKGELFWARNDPECHWIGNEAERRKFMIHWAVYDSQINLPVIYLMQLEDSGQDGPAQGPTPLARGAGASDGAVSGRAETGDHRQGFRSGFRRPAPQTHAPHPCRADVFLGLYRAIRPVAAGAGRRTGARRSGLGAGLDHRRAGKRRG